MLRAAADFRIRRHFEKGRNRSAPLRAMTRPTLVLFTDWDETITARDTLSLIAPPDSPDGDRPPFSFFVDYYLNVMAAHEKAFGPRHTLEKQLEYLGSLGVVEKASVSKVEEYGLFKGVREVDICERTKQVQFRDGWKEFAAQVTKTDHVQFMAVLSVNWSKVFIDCALRRIHDSAFMEKFEIRANVC
jgi:hypothetical protein